MKKIIMLSLVSTVALLGFGCASKSDIGSIEQEKARIAAEMAAKEKTESEPESDRLVWRHPTYKFAFFISPEITAETVSDDEIYFNKTATGEPVGSIKISDFSSYEITNNKNALPDKIDGSTINDITIDGQPGIIVREINPKDTSYEAEQLMTISPNHKLQVIITANGRAENFFSETMDSWTWE